MARLRVQPESKRGAAMSAPTIVTHTPGRFCQLRLASGERVLVSMARSGIVIYRLKFFGLIPAERIAEWAPTDADAARFFATFPTDRPEHPVETVAQALIDAECGSIADVMALVRGKP